MTQVLRTGGTPFDAAAWNRQQYTLQRIRTDPGFETYFRSLRLPFDAVTPRDITCGDERIVGPRVTLPGCGILQSDAELEAFSAALRDCGLPLGRLRRHWDCGAEQLSGFTEAQISAGVLRAAKILGVPVGPACQMLPGGLPLSPESEICSKPASPSLWARISEMRLQSLADFPQLFLSVANDIAFVQPRGYRTQRWRYRQVAELAFRVAREMEGRRIGKGDHVVLWGDNCAEWAAAFFGCMLRGAVAVPIDRIAAPDFIALLAHGSYGKLSATNSAGLPGAPTATTMNCLSSTI